MSSFFYSGQSLFIEHPIHLSLFLHILISVAIAISPFHSPHIASTQCIIKSTLIHLFYPKIFFLFPKASSATKYLVLISILNPQFSQIPVLFNLGFHLPCYVLSVIKFSCFTLPTFILTLCFCSFLIFNSVQFFILIN